MCRHSLVSDEQFGFSAGHSTGDAVTYILQQLHNAIDEKQEAKLICLDICNIHFTVCIDVLCQDRFHWSVTSICPSHKIPYRICRAIGVLSI